MICAVANDHAAVFQPGDYGGVDERPMPKNDRLRPEDLGRKRSVEVEPDGSQVRDFGEKRGLHRRGMVGESKFLRAENDDEGFGHTETL